MKEKEKKSVSIFDIFLEVYLPSGRRKAHGIITMSHRKSIGNSHPYTFSKICERVHARERFSTIKIMWRNLRVSDEKTLLKHFN